jgi:GH15 family glucan-1,4-alpha-glucosidase
MIIPWLAGYENSSPVRVGNAASQQLQLDVLGEVADAMFQARKAGMELTERGRALRPLILEYLAAAWREPDEGIWEVRSGRQHFVHSKVMAWVAFDRAANQLAAEGSIELAKRWREIADEIHSSVCERGFDRKLSSFVQAYGSKWLDASLLLITEGDPPALPGRQQKFDSSRSHAPGSHRRGFDRGPPQAHPSAAAVRALSK